jgi:tRNA(Leu) C34 or U34 (ribose-2'-O)-methylase TrmL
VVLEDIFQPQNASAVLRTCECLGIQNVHIIENRNKFTVDKEVVMGSVKWLNLHKYNKAKHNSLEAIRHLKIKDTGSLPPPRIKMMNSFLILIFQKERLPSFLVRNFPEFRKPF